MATVSKEKWREDFRQWCVDERDHSLRSAELLESGVFSLQHNYVNVSADWAKRNREIAREMDELICKIDEDMKEGR